MFTVNVLIIGSATYFLGLASDIFASIDVDESMSSALLIMDTLLILSLVAYARSSFRQQVSLLGTNEKLNRNAQHVKP